MPPEGERPPGLSIRQLLSDDAPGLGTLMYRAYLGGIEDEGQTQEWHLAQALEALSGSADYGAPIWEACLGVFNSHELVGAVLVTDDRAEALIAFVLVLPQWQKQGVGPEVLIRSGQALEAPGRRDCVLSVADGNPALRLYRRLGFTQFIPPQRRE